MPSMPWISIPMFAEPGQAHAFANREAQLVSLYRALVQAGNAVRQGRLDVRHKHVISGYKGVGKSALILQALGMIRDEDEAREAHKKMVNVGALAEPLDRQRWIILRVSGKHVSNVDALGDELQRAVAQEVEASDPQHKEPLLPLLADIYQQAEGTAIRALDLPIFHRLLRTREFDLYKRVRSSLQAVAYALEYVQRWHGSRQSEKLEQSTSAQSATDVEEQIISQLKTMIGGVPSLPESDTALKIAASIIRKTGASSALSTQVDRQWRVSAQLVVEALNIFFEATTRAKLPTLLVLDDLDEVTSAVGPSIEERSRALSSILGPFTQLKPTCLIISLRQEYMHEDISRQFHQTHVPPMTRNSAALAIECWGEFQQPPLTQEQVRWLQELGDRVLQPFKRTDPVVVPFHFLQLTASLANGSAVAEESNERLLLRYLEEKYLPANVRQFERLAGVMPDDDVMKCAVSSPVEAASYALSESERKDLEQAGLLRPAMAGDPKDTRIVIDPLCAYLRMAKRPIA
ncbi:hypothetical protein [Archangium sp.]|uniref:hypothetical protein n=1 Tax=Archangium sp. TaxID=1872627 RepID=UPI002D47B266|nr:hypothetical protein [Archangium sp.]HYO60015.1 hypothetical protein [Archangium sp.]